jgi:putative ABC transport system permease protein
MDEDICCIPASTFRTMFNMTYPNNAVYRAVSPEYTEPAKESFRAFLASRYKCHPEDEAIVRFWDTVEMQEEQAKVLRGIQIFLGVIGGLTLIIAGIGVANIMYVVVEERTREIGIKMALGAKSGFVLRQFLFETMFLTAFGGIMGFLFSSSIVYLFPRLNFDEYVGVPEISAFVSIGTIVALLIIAILAGYFPARRAATMDPVKALKI